ncbi:cytochrome P450 [Frankia sp. AgB1.9]|uniref:cytochrome P450 n=1 Tax=unclassified Frankia TaxID=2632575 RepID=UPI0019334EDA|nr:MULTISPECIES: cytochrome P450 [unclassified Frankia]MBL7488155.1 cytochrome P450 [Frankia sp. AgW1.1]MBL7553323.1 cytochrome P450 [Frankia sp. AgB1.9]MBL7620158.1 cytochrome P450 [Frankia sp. AgB1.8]
MTPYLAGSAGTADSRDAARSAPSDYPADAVPLFGPRFEQEPAALYREMRARFGPVAPVVLEGGHPAWLVLGYRELVYVTSNPALFARDSRRWNRWPQIPPDWPLLPGVGYLPSVYFAEGVEHRRRAEVVHAGLEAVDHLRLRAQCERIADQLIDTFCGRGEADLVAEYASVIPLLVVAVLFGLDEADTESLVHDLTEMASGSSDALAAFERVGDLFRRVVARARTRPGNDIPSRMALHPAGLTDDEMLMDLVVIASAGQLPTSYWTSAALRLMLVDDRFSTGLSGGRRSVGQALNDVLWEDTPLQNFAGRWAVRTVELGDQRIAAGDLLLLGLAGANADPLVRAGMDRHTPGNHAHLSFSHGEHRCPSPAQAIAEVMATAAVEVILDRLPDVTLAVDSDALLWQPSPWTRGLVSLPVRFSPA